MNKRLCRSCGSQMVTLKCGCGWFDKEGMRRTSSQAPSRPIPIVKNNIDRLVAERKNSPEMLAFAEKLRNSTPEQKVRLRKKMIAKMSAKIISGDRRGAHRDI